MAGAYGAGGEKKMSVSALDIVFGVSLIIFTALNLISCGLGTVLVIRDVISYRRERKKRNGKAR